MFRGISEVMFVHGVVGAEECQGMSQLAVFETR